MGSSKLLQRLGTILNMPEGLIHFRAIDFTMPLLKHNVHLVVDIMQFPKDAKTMRCWKEFSKPPLWHDPDCELVAMWNEAETSQASTSSTTVTSAPRSDASLAAGMDVQLAPSGEDTDELRPGLRQDDGGSSDAGIPANVMASSSHSSRDAGAHQQGPKRVQARVLQEVRQQTQEVRQVPRVRDKIPVERSYKGPGGGFAATIALVTIATSLLRQYHVASNSCTAPGQFEQGQAQAQGLSQSTSLYYDFLDWYHRGEGKIWNSILTMAVQDVTQNMSPEGIAMVHHDLEVNRDYRQEHAADIDRVLASSMRVEHNLRARAADNASDGTEYDWEQVDDSGEL